MNGKKIYGKSKFSPNINNNPTDINFDTIIEPLNVDEPERINHKKQRENIFYSLLSKLFFLWVNPVLSLSNKNELNFKKIIDKSSNLYSPFASKKNLLEGFEKLKRTYKQKNLFLSIIKIYKFDLIISCILSFSLTLTKIIRIKLLGIIIKLFKGDNSYNKFNFLSNNQKIYLFIFFFLSVKLIHTLIGNYNRNRCQIMGNKVNNSLTLLIYDKILTTSIFSQNDVNKGELINYIQTDTDTLNFLFFYAPNTLVVPCQLLINFIMLFRLFGKKFIKALIALFILFVLIWIVQVLYVRNQRKYLNARDERIKMTTSTLQNIKMVKYYTLENFFYKKINNKRKAEMNAYQKQQNAYVLSGLIHWAIPFVLSLVSIALITLNEGDIHIENVIMAIEIFDSMSQPLYRFPIFLTNLNNSLISLRRIEKILLTKDLEGLEYGDDKKEINEKLNKNINLNINNSSIQNDNNSQINNEIPDSDIAIKFKNIDFGIKEKDKVLLNNINMTIKKGEFVGIIGETGSGKTCLVNSILGHYQQLNKDSGTSSIHYIDGRISLAPQIPFIMNDTIKNNIIFFNDLNEERYQNTLYYCHLKNDIESLPGKDFTEVSSNGNNLSGGQRARLSLARAIYHDADIYLFDDPISSVDTIISHKIFEGILLTFLRNKTRILIKNNLTGIEYMDKIIVIEDGTIKWSGKYDEFIKSSIYKNKSTGEINRHKNFRANSMNYLTDYNEGVSNERLLKLRDKIKKDELYKTKGKLTEDEEQKVGKIKTKLFLKFMKLMGNNSYSHIVLILVFTLLWQVFSTYSNIWITKWVTIVDKNKNKKNNTLKNPKNDNLFYFLTYSQLIGASLFFLFLKEFLMSRSLINVYTILHKKIIKRVLKASINLYHDVVTIGQILNGLNNDIDKCKIVIRKYSLITKGFSILVCSLVICFSYNKLSVICLPALFFIIFRLTFYYISAGRDLDRINSISKGPILTCYNETINNIISIRAFGKLNNFKHKFLRTLYNNYFVASFKFGANNWYALYLEIYALIYLFFVCVIACIYKNKFTPGAIGLLLKYSLSFCEQIQHFFEEFSGIERTMIHYERCEQHMNIKQEKYHSDNINMKGPKIKKQSSIALESKPNGFTIVNPSIKLENLSIKYRPTIELTLRNLSLLIKPYEKIGIVGKSGSGKSSLICSLFRIVEPFKGKIYIDNRDITKVSLYDLRNEMVVVPQEPFLFEGTLRDNLDPKKEHTDEEIKKVLKELNMINDSNCNNILEFNVEENGRNFSLGEKQIICFGRALLRKKKIVIFDEVTASVDKKTETIILNLMKHHFSHCTLIMIAHKISNVINCDRIIVMDNGKIVELDTPKKLYSNENSIFRELYDNDNQMN